MGWCARRRAGEPGNGAQESHPLDAPNAPRRLQTPRPVPVGCAPQLPRTGLVHAMAPARASAESSLQRLQLQGGIMSGWLPSATAPTSFVWKKPTLYESEWLYASHPLMIPPCRRPRFRNRLTLVLQTLMLALSGRLWFIDSVTILHFASALARQTVHNSHLSGHI
jgi:hypothetical protein